MSAATLAACAVILGAGFAVGVLLVAQRVPRWAAPSLSRRIAPYLRDIADPVGLTPLSAPTVAWGWRSVRDRLAAGWGGGEALAQRLRQAGRPPDVVSFRATQLAWGVVGLAFGSHCQHDEDTVVA